MQIGRLGRNFSSLLPKSVRIVEVGPRDGLQNEKNLIPTEIKVELINKLSETGLKTIEAASFVSAKYVPQMGDNSEVMKSINVKENINYPVLIPNLRGLKSALEVNCKEIAIFAAASEEFSQANLNCSIKKSFERFEDLISLAKENKLLIRGYVSCVLGCPYSGKVDPDQVKHVTQSLFDLGCYEVSLGDTIGVGTAGSTKILLDSLTNTFDRDKLAVHFHDTYGQALSNIVIALQEGISVIDASVSGLGGCPFAKGATGNVATEDVVYMLDGMGIETGIDLKKLIEAGEYISSFLGRQTSSRVGKALLTKWAN